MLIDVIAVKTLPDYQLLLTFENHEVKCFDMKPYLNATVFAPLKNPSFFKCAKVNYGTVTWGEDIDIAPETLYELSV
ncbi:MAG: DUF2442 domain-containing protein [Methylococcaceae bacterium]